MPAASLRIDADRLHASLRDLAAIGATAGGGVTRLALTDEDRAGRDRLVSWLRDAGLTVRIDDVGNITGLRPGRSDGPPVLLGSHIDTVIRGGKSDGALEVVRALNDAGIVTERPVAVVSWTNEEGVRFEPAMTCAGYAAGRFTKAYIDSRTDRAGLTFADELQRIGYAGDAAHSPLPAAAYLELHIEQGPVLESEGRGVGVVGGIVGITWSEVVIAGQTDHAGPSPMHLRKDALVAAAHVVAGIERFAIDLDPTAVSTVGRFQVAPGIINTIPGEAIFSVDFRHRDPAVLDAQVARLEALVARVCAERGVQGTVRRFWTSEPTPFDPTVLAAVEQGCATLGLDAGHLWSGAGHDAKYVADVCPSAMIFVRSRGGLSHCETEHSDADDIVAGANVLLQAAVSLAGVA